MHDDVELRKMVKVSMILLLVFLLGLALGILAGYRTGIREGVDRINVQDERQE